MSRIQSLLEGRTEQIDYDELIKRHSWILDEHSWILDENSNCIISPDSDGLLCGLFMSHYLNWKVVGFYDGKVMLLKKGLSLKECVFLDMEIFRKDIRSIGQHMLQYNRNRKPSNWDNFNKCVQPNNLRDYDKCHDFRLKYPLATIHMLIAIVGSKVRVQLPESAICPLFFTDGTYNVLFKYPENVLNWLRYLKAGEDTSPLKAIFENKKYSTFSLMLAMDNFFRERDTISIANERGDRLRISNKNSQPYNIVNENDYFKINDNAKERAVRFIKLLSRLTTWEYDENNWNWNKLQLYKFAKGDFNRDGVRLNNVNFEKIILKQPLSWAITSGQNMEYTFEGPDKFP